MAIGFRRSRGSDGSPGEDARPIGHARSPRQALAPERMPPPPSRRARHPLVVAGNVLFTGIVLFVIAGASAFYFGRALLEAPGPLDRERVVVIPRQTGVRDIAEILRRERVVDQPLLFVIGATVMRATSDLKAGEYVFAPKVSMLSVLDTLVEGRSIQHQISIAEGLTSEQIVQRLREASVLSGEIKRVPPEGSLLPESYKVTRGATRDQLLERMAIAHSRVVQEVWDNRSPDLPIETPEELVTLASIVEKETGRADERPRVAAVFINRLKRRMRLQSDPTIIYGLVGGKGSLGRALTREDVEKKTPYNTYAIVGLPPGPIANPGRASLEAVANPSRTKELYFVADGTGGHVFAETYEEHLRNVARWRAHLKDQAAAREEAAGNGAAPQEAEAARESAAAKSAGKGAPAKGAAAKGARVEKTKPKPKNDRKQ